MKKVISVFLIFAAIIGLLTGCGEGSNISSDTETDPNKLTVVATLFPQYDFAREIAGDKANIILLLPPGMESHSFEPAPGDIITIHNSDIFLYTGDEMEPWVSGIVDNIEEKPLVTDLSKGIELCKEEHNHVHEEEPCTDESHNHEDGYVHDDSEHDSHIHDKENGISEEHLHTDESPISSHEGHSHEYNPHIWTSPVLAMTMVENVIDAFVQADPANADYYKANGASYLEKLHDLDHRIRHIVEEADFDTVYVGSKFSLLYFMEEYGLHYVAAYDSCEEEAEPSIKRVVSMIKSMKEAGISAVYYQELIEPYIAETIAEATEGKTYLFHSCHNVSKDDLEAGATYLSLMEQNAVNLQKGLNR